jgi:hypothetical protein
MSRSPSAVGVFIDYDPARPLEMVVKVFDPTSDRDGTHFVDLDDTDPRYLHARVAIAQALGLALRWTAGTTALVAAVNVLGDGRAIYGRQISPLEVIGVGITLSNISNNLLAGNLSARADSDPKRSGEPPA